MKTVFGVEICSAVRCSVLAAVLMSLVEVSLTLEEAFIPPKFPDILSSFAESLSASESLQLLVHSLIEGDQLCGCGEAAKVNWTEFNANLGLYMFAEGPQRCTSQRKTGNTREPNVAAVSGGQADQNRPLVIGLSVTVVIIIIFVVFFLTLNRNSFLHRLTLSQEGSVHSFCMGCCEKKIDKSSGAEKQLPVSPFIEEAPDCGVCK